MLARRAFGRGVLAGCVSFALGGCSLVSMLFPHRYRFKMTVEIDTPNGVKSGSSVYAVSANDTPKLLPEEGARQIEIKGEAVVVDLNGGPIFVLMSGRNRQPTDLVEMSMRALDPQFKDRGDSVESAGRIGDGSQRKGEVGRDDWPMMVRFGDLNDPKSVEQVDPANLAASFGPGVKLRRITVEVTGEPVTVGIGKRLGWLTDGGLTLNVGGKPSVNPPFSGTIRQRAFSTRIDQ